MIIKDCNSSILKVFEIKKQIINVSLNWLNNYNINFTKQFNNIFNKILDNKIIIFFDSYKTVLSKFLIIFHFSKKISEFNSKRVIISMNINNYLQFNDIFNYIYIHDILIGIGNVIINKNFKHIINKYKKIK